MEGFTMSFQSRKINRESFYLSGIEEMMKFNLFLGTRAGFRVLVKHT
jgi:hypothetical protein